MFGQDPIPQCFNNTCEFDGDYAQIPPHMQEAIRRYVVQGLKPGGFLCAVIQNDLKMAVFQADDVNEPLIPLYVRWFYNHAPSACSGSPDHMQKWLDARKQDVAVPA